jgi:hypothetical protein
MIGRCRTLRTFLAFLNFLGPVVLMMDTVGKTLGWLSDFCLRNGTRKGNNSHNDYLCAANGIGNEESPRENSKSLMDQNASNHSEVKKPDALRNILSRRLKLLKDAIDEIDQQINERIKLTGNFKDQIDSEIKECQSLLNKLPHPWREGFLPKMEFIRISLHKSLLTRRKDSRSEDLSFWEDLTSLIKERRKFLMEYEEVKNTLEKLS